MTLLDFFGLRGIAKDAVGATLVVADAATLGRADAFLTRLSERVGALAVAVAGPGRYQGGYPAVTLPAGRLERFYARLQPRRVVVLGRAADRFDLAAAAPCPVAWVNAANPAIAQAGCALVTVADPQLSEQLPGTVPTGDPLLAVAAQASPEFDPEICERFRDHRQAGRWVGYFAATGEDEEAIAYGNFFNLARRKMGLMMVAPADPARYEPVYREAIKYRLPTNRHNRLSTSFVPIKTRVYYVEDPDTLRAMYGCADFVVVGGTLHANARNTPDLLTPMLLGKPVVVGPAGRGPLIEGAIAAGAALAAPDEAAITTELLRLVEDAPLREAVGARARRWAQLQVGATDRVLDLIGQAASAA